MKKAMFIKKINIGAGDALLYKLSEPIKFGSDQETLNVVISAVTGPINGKRATVFPANSDGEILSYEELKESKETLDHEKPLKEMGYEIW